MIFLIGLACTKQTPPPIFVDTFPQTEPRAVPSPPRSETDCQARGVTPGDTVDCVGLLVANADIEQCRLDVARGDFWEDSTRSQWSYRAQDRVACEVRNSAQQVVIGDLSKGKVWQKIETPVAFGAGAACAIFVLWAANEALQ